MPLSLFVFGSGFLHKVSSLEKGALIRIWLLRYQGRVHSSMAHGTSFAGPGLRLWPSEARRATAVAGVLEIRTGVGF